MERDFLGVGSNLYPKTVKEETNQDLAPRGMMEWSFASKTCSAPQILSFGTSHQDRCRTSVSDHLLPCGETDVNRRTYYSSVQNKKTFLGGKSFINGFMNDQTLGGSPTIAPPVSVFPAPTNIRCSSNPTGSPPDQLTIFYAGSVSVYQDISPEKAQAIMLLARNGPQATPISMPKPQNRVHHSPATTYSPTLFPSNGITGLLPRQKMVSLVSTCNNQTDASNMAPPQQVGLPQTRKASLARFLEKRKERVVKVSPYYLDNKSTIDCRTPMSDCLSFPSAHHLC
ncbi:PREDICTED: protein TIFY 6A-like [Camelina sativa]|uniref:Protein TIFY n=1 Tax=Camelina sativa TaxID=90675 RepID=A0ABM0VVG4_CAMSA|nr:PREDICTED: protein TIFY 6A-like [Camelina sativa]